MTKKLGMREKDGIGYVASCFDYDKIVITTSMINNVTWVLI